MTFGWNRAVPPGGRSRRSRQEQAAGAERIFDFPFDKSGHNVRRLYLVLPSWSFLSFWCLGSNDPRASTNFLNNVVRVVPCDFVDRIVFVVHHHRLRQ